MRPIGAGCSIGTTVSGTQPRACFGRTTPASGAVWSRAFAMPWSKSSKATAKRGGQPGRIYPRLTIKPYPNSADMLPLFEDVAMVSAVNHSASVLTQSQSQAQQTRSSPTTTASQQAAFQQSVDKYLQNTTSGVGGGVGTTASQPLSGSLMSSLLQMQQ